MNPFLLGLGPDIEQRLLQQNLNIHLPHRQLHFVLLQLREVEDLLHQPDQPVTLPGDNSDPKLGLFRVIAAGDQGLAPALDAGQRSAQAHERSRR